MPFSRPRLSLSAAFAAIVLAVSIVPAAPRPAAAAGGSGFVDMANGYRSDAGRGPVALNSLIDQIAVERGHQLAAAGQLGHDFAYLERRFDDLGICWRGYGEIVAYNSRVTSPRSATQWYNSTTHRGIMLGDYTHAGGSRRAGTVAAGTA